MRENETFHQYCNRKNISNIEGSINRYKEEIAVSLSVIKRNMFLLEGYKDIGLKEIKEEIRDFLWIYK